MEQEVALIKDFLENLDTKIIAALVAAIASVLVSLANIWHNRKMHTATLANIQKEARIQKLIERRNLLYKKLTEFYLPLNSMINRSKNLYKLFVEGKPDSKEFRVLTHLLKPETVYSDGRKITFSQNDKALLKQIIEIGANIRKLIDEKGGLIEDEELIGVYKPNSEITDVFLKEDVTLLSLIYTHYSVIQLAFEGDLTGEADKFENFVYPRELNKILQYPPDQLHLA